MVIKCHFAEYFNSNISKARILLDFEDEIRFFKKENLKFENIKLSSKALFHNKLKKFSI